MLLFWIAVACITFVPLMRIAETRIAKLAFHLRIIYLTFPNFHSLFLNESYLLQSSLIYFHNYLCSDESDDCFVRSLFLHLPL